ncbi:hypothetical protein ACK83U_21860 (plasmid) [Rhizobium sp. WW22]|uniref:hypothetical protein n=1 Tax=Rhizobium sp. WW22 TaxID=3389070 RepID=UPI00399B32D8
MTDRLVRKLRLGSGLIVFAFVIMHLANHSLGLISLGMAEHAQHWFMVVWRNPLGTVLLYGALILHILLVLRMLYKRRTLVMPAGEAFQIVTGLLVPLLLIDHIVATRIVHEVYGYHDTYKAVVRTLWVNSPFNGMRQSFVLLIVWLHGCIGVHFWLRYRPWYMAIAPVMLSLAIVLPILALLGFAAMGKTVAHEVAQEDERGYPGGITATYEALAKQARRPAVGWRKTCGRTAPDSMAPSVCRSPFFLPSERIADCENGNIRLPFVMQAGKSCMHRAALPCLRQAVSAASRIIRSVEARGNAPPAACRSSREPKICRRPSRWNRKP